MNKITNFILSKTEPPKEAGWLKPLDDGSYGIYVFSNKGWVSTGITKLKIGDNVDITPIEGEVIITDDKIAVGTNTVNSEKNPTVIGFNNTSNGNFPTILGRENTEDDYGAILIGACNNISDSIRTADLLSGGSTTVGYGNTILKGHDTTIIGTYNKVEGQWIFTLGRKNEITSTDATNEEKDNKKNSNFSTIIGQQNTISDGNVSTFLGVRNTLSKSEYSIIVGSDNNFLEITSSAALGYYNTVTGSYGVVAGTKNTISADFDNVLGYENTVEGKQSTVVGFRNTSTGNYSNTFGYQNTTNGQQSTAVGFKNTTTNKYELALGHYNLSEANVTEFSVGNGYKSGDTLKHHNIIMSNQAGDLYIVEKTPTDDSSIIYYEAPMKRLQTWLNEKADTADVDAALEKKQDVLPKVWANILSTKDTIIEIDDQPLKLPAHQSVIIKDFKKVRAHGNTSVSAITRFDFHYNAPSVPMDYILYSSYLWYLYRPNLTAIDVSCFDTSEMTSMANMFDSYNMVTKIDVGGFNTSKVTNMYSMFLDCRLCTTLDVSGFDTSNVTNMAGMFSLCESLTTLDVSNFDTSKVTDLTEMFMNDDKLLALNVDNWDTSNVESASRMFDGCSSLYYLNVSKWNTGKCKYMGALFRDCSSLESLNLSNWDLTNTTTIEYMFLNCSKLKSITFGEGWGKNTASLNLDLSSCASAVDYNLTNDTFNSMLNMYDRVTNGLTNTFTIKFSSKHTIPDGWTDKMTAKGYTIVIG